MKLASPTDLRMWVWPKARAGNSPWMVLQSAETSCQIQCWHDSVTPGKNAKHRQAEMTEMTGTALTLLWVQDSSSERNQAVKRKGGKEGKKEVAGEEGGVSNNTIKPLGRSTSSTWVLMMIIAYRVAWAAMGCPICSSLSSTVVNSLSKRAIIFSAPSSAASPVDTNILSTSTSVAVRVKKITRMS